MRFISALGVLGAATLIAAAAGAQEQASPPQGEFTRRAVGDWTVLCAPAGEPCVIEQKGQTAQGETALNIQVERLPEPQTVGGQRVSAVANILVPLGVLLPQGLELQIDQGEKAASPFFVCQQAGCLVRAPLQDELLERFRRGAKARFRYAGLDNGQPREVALEISLSGFTRAFDELK